MGETQGTVVRFVVSARRLHCFWWRFEVSDRFQFHCVTSCCYCVCGPSLQDLEDGLNYGLFCPPDNGRAGKFMDEERLLTDYALPGPIGYLEVVSAISSAVYIILIV